MSIFTELKQQLSQQLEMLPDNAGLVELRAEIKVNAMPNLLAWLKSQVQFPQHFWQSRDQDLAFATLGAACEFSDLEQAQAFSQQHGFRLFGGLQFDGQCRLVLPRLVLATSASNLTACLYLENRNDRDILAHFDQFSALEMSQNSRLGEQSVSDFARWEANITAAIHAIQQGEFRKVVLANATQLTFENPISPYDLLAASQQKNLGCYHFLWAETAGEAFVGSSPERLYQRQGDQFETEALAGTVAVCDDAAQTERNRIWLLNDPKNIEENQYVVDDIQSHLADCVSEFHVSPVEIKQLHNVQHLRRKIRATLNGNISDRDCLTRIHPTAAVAGLPRAQAVKFIQQNEGFSRGWYAGTFGNFTPTQAEFCVALRSAHIAHNAITLYAGAGIVEGSQPQSEWEEIGRKSLAIRRLLF